MGFSFLFLLSSFLYQDSFGTVKIGTTVFSPGEGGFPCIRVPAITSTSSGALVAFAECRYYTGDGCNPIHYAPLSNSSSDRWICQKVSTDDGETWSNLSFPFGSEHTSFNPTVVFDAVSQKIILQANVYNLLPNQTIYQIESTDDGKTWNNVIDIGKFFNVSDNANFWPGPSTGLQLKSKEKYGRILWSGHTDEGSYVWYSDDFGRTYNLSTTSSNDNNMYQMQEGALMELSNGSILDNMRNSNYFDCNCRGFAMSNDYGLSFGNAYPEKTLQSPQCQGSSLSVDVNGEHFLFFSLPDSTTNRMNMTVKKSMDDGATWSSGYPLCEECGGAYSCLTALHANNSFIGLLWETNSTQFCKDGVESWACQTVYTPVSVNV